MWWQDRVGVHGWLYDEEKMFLLALGAQAYVGIVEIGSWKGLSTIQLARGAKVPVYSIDPHKDTTLHKQLGVKDTFSIFSKNISKAGLVDKIHPLRMSSLEAAKKYPTLEFDVLFVDGDHDYEPTLEYYDSWATKVPVSGIIAFHDAFNDKVPGVHKVWEEKINLPKWKRLETVRTIGVARRLIG